MKKVELIKGISSSILGFGCAPIMGSVDASKAKRAIDCAIDYGINHFDLARSYGYGDAERFIGKQLKNKRNDVIIASKFGIKANFKAKLLNPFKPIIRFGLSKLKKSELGPSISNIAERQIADKFHYRISLTAPEMHRSLIESLRALQTDFLDYFFIHEPLHTIENIDELIDMSERLKKEGKIRAFGLAFMQVQKHYHTAYLNKFDILQFNNSPLMSNYLGIVDECANTSNIFFSPLGGDKTVSASSKLLKLADDFNKSIILCSMYNEAHLKSNALLFS